MAEFSGLSEHDVSQEITISEPPPIHIPTLEELKAQDELARVQEQNNPQMQRAMEDIRARRLVLRQAQETGAITEQQAEEMAVRIEAMERVEVDTDALTGLYARRASERRLVQELARADREGTPLTVAILDLDKFKGINDEYGHAVGDATLQAVAGHILSEIRVSDTPLRYGGEELGLILPNTQAENAMILLDRLRGKMPGTVKEALEGQGINLGRDVTVSIGVAELTSGEIKDFNREISSAKTDNKEIAGKVMRSVFEKADGPLYQAKDSGRNKIVLRQPPIGK